MGQVHTGEFGPAAFSEHWCPHDAGDAVFASRSAAERLHGIDFLKTQPGTTGERVNVVVVDQGLNKEVLGDRYGGGWKVGDTRPGTARPEPGSRRRPHGMMIAHNILAIAPKATLFDLPLAPVKISDIQAFLKVAVPKYREMLDDIAQWRETKERSGPWILVNPWGIFDRHSEQPKGHYTETLESPLNQMIKDAVSKNIDVVFVAGNCGQFCADDRCGPTDQGPGHSIWGANSLDAVLTVGAVRADGMWLGYSSQGPGQKQLGIRKPDLCAASNFRDDDDAFSIHTGTSAACAMAAGVIAALRSKWHSQTVSPLALKDVLNQTALPSGGEWNPRLGHGILNARAAFKALANSAAVAAPSASA
ncbi:MAG TPA: S8/S53 family peptidase [Beijerinckiaceae bacterium]|jgi:hypothetical protein